MTRQAQIMALQGLRLELQQIAAQLDSDPARADAAARLRARAKGAEDWMVALSQTLRQYATVTADGVAGAAVDTVAAIALVWDPTTQILTAVVDGKLVPMTAGELAEAWAAYDARP